MQTAWKTEERLQQQIEEIPVIVEVVKEIAALVVMAIGIVVEIEAVAVMAIATEENLALAGKAMDIVVMVNVFLTVVMMAVSSVIGIGIEDFLKEEILNLDDEMTHGKQGEMEIDTVMNLPEIVEIESVDDHLMARRVRTTGLTAWWLLASRKLWQEAQGQRIRSFGAWRHPR